MNSTCFGTGALLSRCSSIICHARASSSIFTYHGPGAGHSPCLVCGKCFLAQHRYHGHEQLVTALNGCMYYDASMVIALHGGSNHLHRSLQVIHGVQPGEVRSL